MRCGSGADGVIAAVDVDDLAGGGGEQVGEQGDARGSDGRGVFDVPAERCPLVPGILELLETRYAAGRDRADGAGGDEVHAYALGPEVACEVARGRLERGLRDAHPVVDR